FLLAFSPRRGASLQACHANIPVGILPPTWSKPPGLPCQHSCWHSPPDVEQASRLAMPTFLLAFFPRRGASLQACHANIPVGILPPTWSKPPDLPCQHSCWHSSPNVEQASRLAIPTFLLAFSPRRGASLQTCHANIPVGILPPTWSKPPGLPSQPSCWHS